MKAARPFPVQSGKSGCRQTVCGLCLLLASGMTQAQSLEMPVKAAFVFKFGLFVEWPVKAFAAATSPVNLCIFGEDPFGDVIDKATQGQQIGGRAVVVRRLKTAPRDAGCHVLYVGSFDTPKPLQVLESMRGSPVLTITDSEKTGTPPGIINFVVRDNRVRFDIDDRAAAQSGLGISSRLLSLALNVKPR